MQRFIRSLRKSDPRSWLNIFWISIFIIYISYLILFTRQNPFPGAIAGDYRAFYATAQITLSKGIYQVYNLDTQRQFQMILHAQSPFEASQLHTDPVPMPYLPAFILLFLPLLLFSYVPGFIIWGLVNLTVLVAYLYHFIRALGYKNEQMLLWQLVISLSVASNLLIGQINVFMVVCLGEFILACLDKKEWRAGLWLGGLLLKPQILIFILPGLLIRKRIRLLAGFSTCAAILLGLSLILVGPFGLRDLASLILQYIHGLPTNSPEVMMNWRAVAVNLGLVLPHPVGWVLAWVGIVLTAYLTLSLWTIPVDARSPQFGYLLLGTFAGSFMVAWHSHNHMEMVLIPIIFFLYVRKMLPWKILYLWLFAPALALAVMYLIFPASAYNLFGLITLAINLILLVWSYRYLHTSQPERMLQLTKASL